MTKEGRRLQQQHELDTHVVAALRHLAAALKLAEKLEDRNADFRLYYALATLRRVWRNMKQARG